MPRGNGKELVEGVRKAEVEGEGKAKAKAKAKGKWDCNRQAQGETFIMPRISQ